MSDELKPLSKKHQRVLDEYLIGFVQWRAYKTVYPKSSDEVSRTLASRLFANDNFNAHLQARLNEAHMSADEALKLTANIARGDITQLLTPLGSIDLDYIRDNGLGQLIKKVKVRTITKIGKGDKDDDTEIIDTELEMYPADAAQDKILRIHKKYTDPADEGKDVKITVTIKGVDD